MSGAKTIQELLRFVARERSRIEEMPHEETLEWKAANEIDRLRAELAEKDKLIEELMQIVMAVETKHPGEKRWETALRYVMEAENRPCGTAKSEVSDE